jgi:hypothetical protein
VAASAVTSWRGVRTLIRVAPSAGVDDASSRFDDWVSAGPESTHCCTTPLQAVRQSVPLIGVLLSVHLGYGTRLYCGAMSQDAAEGCATATFSYHEFIA